MLTLIKHLLHLLCCYGVCVCVCEVILCLEKHVVPYKKVLFVSSLQAQNKMMIHGKRQRHKTEAKRSVGEVSATSSLQRQKVRLHFKILSRSVFNHFSQFRIVGKFKRAVQDSSKLNETKVWASRDVGLDHLGQYQINFKKVIWLLMFDKVNQNH